MNTTPTINEHGESPEHNPVKESSTFESVKSMKVEHAGEQKHKKHGILFDVISSILTILAGIFIVNATGLYDGMDSTIGKIGLGFVISYSYLAAFRCGLYSK